MNIAADIVDKYKDEQIIIYLDVLLGGVLKNYNVALEKGATELLFANLGDISQAKAIIHEMKKRNELRNISK